MGPSLSHSEDSPSSQLISHPRLKSVKFANNNETMRVHIQVESDEFAKFQQRLSRLANFDEYYLLLPKSYHFSKKAICGSSGILQIDYQNYPYLLSDELRIRTNKKNHFTQSQMWYLLYGLLSSAHTFSQINQKIGDVRSSNIFLNQQGQVKISNICSWPSEHTNYQKLVLQHTPTYVAPEQLSCAQEGRLQIYRNLRNLNACDQYLCESFSIGLTMLQNAILINSASLYIPNHQFNTKQLSQRVYRLLKMSIYSPALKISIASLCEYSAGDRMSSLELYNHFKEFDSEIINLRECEFEIPNPKNRAVYNKIMGIGKAPVYANGNNSNNNHISDHNVVVKKDTNPVSSSNWQVSPQSYKFQPTPQSSIHRPIQPINQPTFVPPFQQTIPQPQYSQGQPTHQMYQNSQFYQQQQLNNNPNNFRALEGPVQKQWPQYHPTNPTQNWQQPPQQQFYQVPIKPQPATMNRQTLTRRPISNSNQPDFSNISSIPKQPQDYESAHKMAQTLNAFTPTQKNSEDGDLLRKIEQSILDSQKKFNENT